jgi:hypothetical protein
MSFVELYCSSVAFSTAFKSKFVCQSRGHPKVKIKETVSRHVFTSGFSSNISSWPNFASLIFFACDLKLAKIV